MNNSLRTGLTFGLTSAVITTMGLMVGLSSGTRSKMVVLGGILTIAIADAFSDALGIHVSEESENVHTAKEIWGATAVTFLTKCIFALTFTIPVLLVSLPIAVIINIFWGLTIITVMSYLIARSQNQQAWKIIGEHLFISILVIGITHYIGELVGKMSG